MKESRATELWCPHRALVAATNHKLDDYGLCSCMGNACMMWEKDYSIHIQDDKPMVEDIGGHCGLTK